jgi:hypothetical protein
LSDRPSPKEEFGHVTFPRAALRGSVSVSSCKGFLEQMFLG